MYYHFRPGKGYWIVLILARKGLISLAALVFRANPGFQLAFVMLVLFWSYVMQVQNRPFMSTSGRKAVVLEHRLKAERGDKTHMLIESKREEAVLNARQGK